MINEFIRALADCGVDIFGIAEGVAQMKESVDTPDSTEYVLARLMLIVSSLALFTKVVSLFEKMAKSAMDEMIHTLSMIGLLFMETVVAIIFTVYLGKEDMELERHFHYFWVCSTYLSVIARAFELAEGGTD